VAANPLLLLDWGAKAHLYLSDLTRILVTGKISPKLERIYGVVLKAQEQAIAAIRPGALMSDVDAAARNVITKAGYGKQFGHGLGHGFGLEIHETTRLAANQDRPLKAGMVITVEPGIYLPGWGGVRIEDDILVTRTGHEVLSSLPKTLEQCVVE
jgi:Xaa-Pro aminopeptidase